MRVALREVASGARRTPVGHALLGVGLLALVGAALLLFVRLREPTHVVETVTTVARPLTAVAATPTPVVYAPQLPARDADVEQAGDRIAEAEVYLRKRQGAAALSALARARRATTRAIETRQRTGARHEVLTTALRELGAVEHAIERGAYEDARRQLVALDKSLDQPDN